MVNASLDQEVHSILPIIQLAEAELWCTSQGAAQKPMEETKQRGSRQYHITSHLRSTLKQWIDPASPSPWPHPRLLGSESPLNCGVWKMQPPSNQRTFLLFISLSKSCFYWPGRSGRFSQHRVPGYEVLYLCPWCWVDSFTLLSIHIDHPHGTGTCYWILNIPWTPSVAKLLK